MFVLRLLRIGALASGGRGSQNWEPGPSAWMNERYSYWLVVLMEMVCVHVLGLILRVGVVLSTCAFLRIARL
jgi:hypothetical protein